MQSSCNILLYIHFSETVFSFPHFYTLLSVPFNPMNPGKLICLNTELLEPRLYKKYVKLFKIVQMTLGGPRCRLQTCRCREAQWFDSTFWAEIILESFFFTLKCLRNLIILRRLSPSLPSSFATISPCNKNLPRIECN